MDILSRNHWLFTVLVIMGMGMTGGQANAQISLGLEGGYARNYLHNDDPGGWSMGKEGVGGITFGIPVLYQYNTRFFLYAAPSFCQKNYFSRPAGSFAGIYEEHRNTYLQLPVMVRYLFVRKKFGGYLQCGIFSAWWAAGKIAGVSPNIFSIYDSAGGGGQPVEYIRLEAFKTTYHFDARKDNRLEWGWEAGAGVQYSVNGTYSAFVDGRYTGSLSSRQKEYMIGETASYNRTWYLSAGGLMKLTFSKKPAVKSGNL